MSLNPTLVDPARLECYSLGLKPCKSRVAIPWRTAP